MLLAVAMNAQSLSNHCVCANSSLKQKVC